MFWHLTPREIWFIFSGVAAMREREHNDRAWLAWHTAFLSSYAPKKHKEFWKLKTLLWKSAAPSPEQSRKPSWKQSFSAFSAWAKGKKS
ncbi:hypothetical protein [Rhizobium leguminosarum]|uniref:hypothetical protein n=1 Tax=Rhizobium leguminosarum TaxID=384 RepID=UPI000482AA53|nr:hypothetical protein [Rhizobium leguminosarum]